MRRARALAVVAAAVSTLVALAAGVDRAQANETVWSCGLLNAGGQNNVFAAHGVAGINLSNTCASGGSLSIDAPTNTVPYGKSASWSAGPPPGLQIALAYVDPPNLNAYTGGAYQLAFFWAGGHRTVNYVGSGSIGVAGLHTGYFGFSATCQVKPSCNGAALLTVSDIGLQAQETQGPSLSAPDWLWQASGWVRGDWPLHFNGNSPSGICTLSASVDGQSVALASFPQNVTVWHQCSATGVSSMVHTSQFTSGPAPLTIRGSDAAGVSTSDAAYTKALYVDNQQPGVAFSGPSDAPASARTQYVSVTGVAGPSGISGVGCSLDGAPYQWYAQRSALIAVSGVAVHHLSCASANNARDAAGHVASSSPQTWTLSIRAPTVAGISFGSQILNALRCQRARERIRVPAHWVRVRRHGKLVKLRRSAHTKTVSVVRCHPRVVYTRERVLVHGHERWRSVRRVLLPSTIERSTSTVRHGAATTVEGWLGTSSGIALGGQTVSILTAADNGQHAFRLAAIARTRADGSWRAKLRPGPSRLVEAFYGGTGTTEPTVSGQIRLMVPASVRLLSVEPHHVSWGGTVRIVGQLQGGYLPPGGALVRLRIGFGPAYTTYGVQEHVTGNGRFSTTYTFGAGVLGVVRQYWFSIASLPMGDYPWAPANSRRIYVSVG